MDTKPNKAEYVPEIVALARSLDWGVHAGHKERHPRLVPRLAALK